MCQSASYIPGMHMNIHIYIYMCSHLSPPRIRPPQNLSSIKSFIEMMEACGVILPRWEPSLTNKPGKSLIIEEPGLTIGDAAAISTTNDPLDPLLRFFGAFIFSLSSAFQACESSQDECDSFDSDS